jgi:hypothetical protein
LNTSKLNTWKREKEVSQITYTHVSKCKNDKKKYLERKKEYNTKYVSISAHAIGRSVNLL